MKSLTITIVIACLVVGVICFAMQTATPSHFWLWIAGLAGPVLGAFQFVLRYLLGVFQQPPRHDQPIAHSGGSGRQVRKIRTP